VSELIDDQHRELAGEEGGGTGRYAECAYVQELAAGFALGALDPEDNEKIIDHLAACPPCRWIVSQARQTVSMLAFSSPAAAPPLHAKAALFSRIAQSSRTPTELPSPTVTIPASNADSRTAPATESRWRLPLFGRPDASRPSRLYLPLLATVPLVLALALVGGFAMTSQADVDDLQAQLLSVRQDLNDTQESLDTVDEFRARADTMVYELPGQEGEGSDGARGTVFANPGTNEAVLMVSGLEDEPKDCRYEVWLEGPDGYVVRAAEFGVDSEGRSAVWLNLNQPFDDYTTLHIKRKNAETDLLSTQVPSGDALYAKIGPDVDRIFDRVGAVAE
jgi:hypothetical protein